MREPNASEFLAVPVDLSNGARSTCWLRSMDCKACLVGNATPKVKEPAAYTRSEIDEGAAAHTSGLLLPASIDSCCTFWGFLFFRVDFFCGDLAASPSWTSSMLGLSSLQMP
jgi:hypothetical protein